MKKNIKLIKFTSVLLVMFLVFTIYLFAFPLKAKNDVNIKLMEFDETYDDATGFVDGNDLTNENKFVASNENFELYLDETTTHFYIKDIKSGNVIQSNPSIEDPAGPSDIIKERQNSTIEYTYFNTSGAKSSINNNYSKSIYHPETPEYTEGHRTYKIKEVENGFQVFYRITTIDIDYLYFPLYLTPEQIEPILENRSHPARREIMNAYSDVKDSSTGLYKARNYENMSKLIRVSLYRLFYEEKIFGDYTRNRSISENAENGYFNVIERFGFDVAVQVLLQKDGVEVKLINNSIREYSESKLAEVTLYPYFGSAIDFDPITQNENEGYLVIPDGSGAILEFNNGKTTARSYSKRLYGGDFSSMPFEMPEEQEKILIPVFGMVKENIGYAAIIHEGDALATLNASVSGISNNSYNRIYTTYNLRETELAILGFGNNRHEINLWTKDIAKTDITIQYKILLGDNNNYVGVANAYQNYLIEEHDLQLNDSNNKKVTIEFLGAYDKRSMILGVPYTTIDSLTNYHQATEIIESLGELGVENLNVIFSGITNGGLDNTFETKVRFEKSVGSKKEFERFNEVMNKKGIDVFTTANFFSTSEYNKMFEENRYGTNRLRGDRSKIFEYNIPTRLPYSETVYEYKDDHFVINPKYYNDIFKKYEKSFSFQNLMLDGIGSNLSGNYKKNNVVYLSESLEYQKDLISKISKNKTLALSEPLGFSYPYLDYAMDLPIESTLYTVLDYRIPLVQLVLNKIAGYSHKSINLASKRDVDYQFLKALENGSGLKYTLSYNSSLDLLGTYHNQYMSTEYSNWLDIIEEQNNVLQSNGLNNVYIIEHERIQNNVFKTTYNNGVYVITNYNLFNVTVDGNIIDSIGYHIGGGQ